MIEVEMTKDIKEYAPKLIGPFSLRQTGLLALGLSYAVPLAIFLPFDITINILIAAITMTPVFMCAFLQMYGMKMEEFVLQIIRSTIICPKKRRYKVSEKDGVLGFIRKGHKKSSTQKKKIIRSPKYPSHR